MPGDRLLLCSDGLCKTVPEEQLADLLSGDADSGAERLVLAALTAQAADNITAVTIEFGAGEGPALQAQSVDTPASNPPGATEHTMEVERDPG